MDSPKTDFEFLNQCQTENTGRVLGPKAETECGTFEARDLWMRRLVYGAQGRLLSRLVTSRVK